MPTLMNCTPHEIVVVHPSSASYDEKLRKHILVQPLQPEVELARILPSGTMLSVSFETRYEGDINGSVLQ